MKTESASDKPLDVLVEEKTPPQRTLYTQHLDVAATAALQGRQQRRDTGAAEWLAAHKDELESFPVTRIPPVETRKATFKRRGHIRAGVSIKPLPPPCNAAASRTDGEAQAITLKHDQLARKIATKARGHAIPLGATDDHLQSARLGLLEAAPRFDPAKGRFGSFGTYASWYALEQVAAQNRLNQSVVDGGGFDVRLDTPIATDDAELAATLANSMIVGPDGKGSFPGPRSGAVPRIRAAGILAGTAHGPGCCTGRASGSGAQHSRSPLAGR